MIRQFLTARCDYGEGELHAIRFTPEFKEKSALFRADILQDLLAVLMAEYRRSLDELQEAIERERKGLGGNI